jgi:hypothetical protein
MVENNLTPNEINETDDFVMAQLEGMSEPAIFNVLDLIDDSVPMTDQQTRNERMSICRQCDQFGEGTVCMECNCTMKFKTWLAFGSECPLGKW